MNTNLLKNMALAASVCLSLSGCVVAAAADLAATTVLTAGKLAVKGTGAIISAAIPDGDDEDDEKAERKSRPSQAQPVRNETLTQPPAHERVGRSAPAYYGTSNTHSVNHVNQAVPEIAPPRHITITPQGAVYESTQGEAVLESFRE